MMIAGVLLWTRAPSLPESPGQRESFASHFCVASRPLTQEQMVLTRPRLDVVESPAASVSIIQTVDASQLERVSNQELLALLPDCPLAVLENEPDESQLILLNQQEEPAETEDQHGQ
jgi:hypothetical protein